MTKPHYRRINGRWVAHIRQSQAGELLRAAREIAQHMDNDFDGFYVIAWDKGGAFSHAWACGDGVRPRLASALVRVTSAEMATKAAFADYVEQIE